MSWTDEKVAKLKELWGKGNTASQIAEILGGVSRNAVIGKAHRLNLSGKIVAKRGSHNQKIDKSKNLNTFLNFNNTTLGEIIKNHNALEKINFKKQRDKLTKMVNRRSVGKFRNDDIDISEEDINNIRHMDILPKDIEFSIENLDHFIEHFDDDHDLSPESTDSPSTPITKRTIRT